MSDVFFIFVPMKKIYALFVLLLFVATLHAKPVHFASKPSLSPDGTEIFFAWDGDIFRVPAEGGLALKIVSMKGTETAPLVSPDGKHLAFAANEQGDYNVYVVPLAGGPAVQLTHNDASDIPVSWSPDSKHIYFESNRYNNVSTYSVPITGGTPRRLFPHYFNTISSLVEDPVTGTFYFIESAESYRFATRKGYKGEHNANILSWNPKTEEYKELTTWIGKDQWPMVDKNGTLYYVSDEKNGEDNLVKHVNNERVFITEYTEPVRYPSISYDGSRIVFLKGYQIHWLDTQTGTLTKPEISIVDTKKNVDISVKIETPSDAALSPDGKKLAFSFRGMLFVSDNEGNFIQQIETPAQERVAEVVWGTDSKTLYYTRTNKGYYHIFKTRADVPGAETLVYESAGKARSLTPSPKGDKIAFVSGKRSLMVLDTKKDHTEKLADQEFWAHQNYSIAFSHDQKHLAFTAMNMFEQDVYIYSFDTKEVLNLTHSAVSESAPVFTPDGKYLYLLTNRTAASYPGGASMSLYKVALQKNQKPLATEAYEQLFQNNKADGKDSLVVIDQKSLQRRFERVVRTGSQSNPYIFSQKDKSWLLYGSNHEGTFGVYIQELKDWDQKPATQIKGLRMARKFITNGKDLFALGMDGLYKINPGAGSATKVTLTTHANKSITQEFEQMFYEVWATLEQNFYDHTFHGVNWEEKRDYYAGFLPYAQSRDDLRTLTNDMLNELNSSHMGFSTRGTEEAAPGKNTTMATGVLFCEDNPYIVDRILAESPADFALNPIAPGDKLVAVNGAKVDPNTNREQYFISATPHKEITLRFAKANNQEEYNVKLHTTSTAALRDLLYTEWEDANREYVENKSKGTLAYVHMRDMSSGALQNFLIDMHTYAVHKDGLILDLRYNNGGNVHREVIDFLSRKSHFHWKYREGQVNTHPNVTPGDKPIVVLINERSLSDAEVTSNGIKELSIAKLIGTETYRWIIFTSGAGMVDGSSVRLPAWGCYSLDGKDLEITGVAPDISVRNTFDDRLKSRDPQLDTALKELLSD